MSKYNRILLKLSGEALSSPEHTIDPTTLSDVVGIIKSALTSNVEVAIVVGGGNIFRGAGLAESGMNRITGDHMGMLATVINALAIADACTRSDIDAIVMSGFPIGGGVCDPADHNLAKKHLSEGKVVIFSAGTGSPCFTTDTGAALRGIEIDADIIFKATKVDGVYSDDPLINQDAIRYDSVTFDEAIEKNLKVMDMTAFTLCKDHGLKICVFSMLENPNTLSDILNGAPLGTMVG
ncbi:MAG: UMP kinase [PS1 clade bacterium]